MLNSMAKIRIKMNNISDEIERNGEVKAGGLTEG